MKLALVAALGVALLAPARGRAEPAVRYLVRIDQAALVRAAPDVVVEVASAPAPLELVFPAWLPGAYELRFYGRDASRLEASDEGGKALTVERDGPCRVTITGHAAGARVRVRYRAVAELLSDDGADVNLDHVYLNPGAIVPLVRGREHGAHVLELSALPRNWVSLTSAGSGELGTRIQSDSYLGLIDQPIEAAHPDSIVTSETTVAGARFVVAIHADLPARDRARKLLPTIARDLGRIAEAERALAGPLPFARYLFIIHLSERAARLAGLEHAAAASVVATPRLLGAEDYGELLHVLSHELFHAWNARRLVPTELVAPTLEALQPSASLWITEGLTEHVALVALARAGLLSRAELGAAIEEALTRARAAERAGLSLSMLAKLAFSAPSALAGDPDAYYAIGHVVSLALVAELLTRTSGKVGVEELLAALLPKPGAPPRTIDLGSLGRTLDALAPVRPGERPLSALLGLWVDQPFSLEALVPTLAAVGVHIESRHRERVDLAALADGEPPTLRLFEPGGAFARAGSQRGDQVLRIDGAPAHATTINQLARMPRPAPLHLEISRGGETLSLIVEPRRIDDVVVKLAPDVLAAHERGGAATLARLLGVLPRR